MPLLVEKTLSETEASKSRSEIQEIESTTWQLALAPGRPGQALHLHSNNPSLELYWHPNNREPKRQRSSSRKTREKAKEKNEKMTGPVSVAKQGMAG